MRTTVDPPDQLLRDARARAAAESTTLTALLSEGLRLRLAAEARLLPRPLPVSPKQGGLRAGIDPSLSSSLLDAADDLS